MAIETGGGSPTGGRVRVLYVSGSHHACTGHWAKADRSAPDSLSARGRAMYAR